MKKSIKEILDIEQFDFYIHPSDLVFFIDKPKNRTLISQKLHEKMSKYIEKIVKFRVDIIEKLNNYAKIIQKELTEEKEEINLIYNIDSKF